MAKKGVHVSPQGGKWTVRREGSKRAPSVHETLKEAEKKGRQVARKDGAEFFLHNRNGQIRERDSYGKDPNPPKG